MSRSVMTPIGRFVSLSSTTGISPQSWSTIILATSCNDVSATQHAGSLVMISLTCISNHLHNLSLGKKNNAFSIRWRAQFAFRLDLSARNLGCAFERRGCGGEMLHFGAPGVGANIAQTHQKSKRTKSRQHRAVSYR